MIVLWTRPMWLDSMETFHTDTPLYTWSGGRPNSCSKQIESVHFTSA